MKPTMLLTSALCLCVAAPAMAQTVMAAPATRFQDMDTDRNGEISRAEWRGNDRSFRNQDWNGDGKLSGNEIRAGARRNGRDTERTTGTSGTADRFVDLDSNRDGRLTLEEWHGSAVVFEALDANGDGRLTRQEAVGAPTADQTEFTSLDVNGDGAIARSEWQWNEAAFARLDTNRDGRVTRQEFGKQVADVPPQQTAAYRSLDVNGDGAVTRSEWPWNRAAFERLDTNRDGRLTLQEFGSAESAPPAQTAQPLQTAAYRAGYTRGHSDGVQAGREDKPRGWDLEGQRELENADAGYEGRHGSLTDYREGYRAAFRRGYGEGFGPRD